MKCREFDKNLDLFLAGALRQSLNKAMVKHMGTCPVCRILYKQENELVHTLKGLKMNVPPDGNLWERIETGISRKESLTRQIVNLFANHKPVFIVSLCVFFIGIVFGALILGPFTRNRSWLKTGIMDSGIIREFATADIAYQEARSSLLDSLHHLRQVIDQETITTLEKNLKMIDHAISDIKTAIYNHPENQQNIIRLADLYQEETRYILKTNSMLNSIN